MLAPEGFAGHPEINAVLKNKTPLNSDRAKIIAEEIVARLRDHLPKFTAARETIRVVEDLKKAVTATVTAVVQADAILLADPEHHLTPNHEIAHRASRILRQIVVERQILKDEDLISVVPECYERARQEMKDRGSLPTEEPFDPIPMSLLDLRRRLTVVDEIMTMSQASVDLIKRYLDLSLFPYLSARRPSLDLAMFLAWLLQDATTRGMNDARFATWIEDAFNVLPSEWMKLAPSQSTVTKWRLEREKIPEIPHYSRPHKPR